MADKNVMSLRLDAELTDVVDLITEVLGQKKSEFIRDAIRGHITRIRAEAGFNEAVELYLNKRRRLLTPEATNG
jgi:metal-responsive CopG/Arc/MetJ family transcriptional regulator